MLVELFLFSRLQLIRSETVLPEKSRGSPYLIIYFTLPAFLRRIIWSAIESQKVINVMSCDTVFEQV